MYHSQTFPTVLKGLAGDESLMRSTFTVAYDSILPAWQWFLAHTGSKPIILVGDSQGAAILIHLISAQLDHQPTVLRRLLVAILVVGNLQVPAEAILPGAVDTGPAWGYHGYEYNLTLGNLLHDVAGEEAAWQSSH